MRDKPNVMCPFSAESVCGKVCGFVSNLASRSSRRKSPYRVLVSTLRFSLFEREFSDKMGHVGASSGRCTVFPLVHFLTRRLPNLPSRADTPCPGLSPGEVPPSLCVSDPVFWNGPFRDNLPESVVLTVRLPLPPSDRTAASGTCPAPLMTRWPIQWELSSVVAIGSCA